jgi:hypothetical protein
MVLAEIAAGIEVTAEQRDRGVAEADDTDAPLEARLERFDGRLPCSPAATAALVEAYLGGASIDRAAAVAGVPETTAAKALYLLGEPIDPLTPTAKRVLEDWLAGDLSRTEARRLAGVGDAAFALGAYVATHEPIEGADEAVAEAAPVPTDEDPLSDARSDLEDLI